MKFLGSREARIAFLVLALAAVLVPGVATADTEALDFYTLTGTPPCRLYDSRMVPPGVLVANDTRTVTIAGACGVPANAAAVALNLTVAQPTASGNLSLYPAGATVAPGVPPPAIASLSFKSGVNQAMILMVELGASGDLVAQNNSTGTLHFIIDISGYFIENQAPTDIALDDTTVSEGQPAGTLVGNLSTTDPDPGETFTYSLVSGVGDTDNASFQIVGDQLQTAAVLDFEAQPSYSVRIRSMDSGGLFFEEVFTITATGDNEAPTDITLSPSAVDENQASGTAVGTFSTTDPDVGDTFTYTLVAGVGDTDNGSFTIVGNQLQTAAIFDFETKSSYSIRVRSTDGGGLFFEKTFTVTVNNVNETPTDIALSSTTVNEGQPAGTVVGTLTTTDPDAGDTFTYTLVAGAGDTDNGSFTIAGNQLLTAAVFDLETKSSYSIRVRSTDAGGLFFEEVFTITVTNVNEAPTDIALSPSSVDEGQAAGTTVGTLSTTDPDAGDTFTYTLVAGAGDTDNGSFTIAGNLLQTAAIFDFETKSSYSIRVRSTDAGGLFFEKVFTITVNNVNEAPTDIALDNATLAENQPANTAVGNFSTTDPDAGDTFTYTLVAGAGATDNGSFTIVGNQLRTAAVLDFETKSSYSIRVRSTDAGSLFFEEVFTITVTNVNEQPTDIALSPTSVNEGQPAGTAVGTFSTTDPDVGDTFTYTLVAGAGSADNGSFTIVGNQLQTAAVLDFETKSSYSIRVRSTDSGGLFLEEVFTITVNNVNEAPTDIALSNASVNENQPIATPVGNFSTTDPDTGDTFTYTLVAGVGDTDNGMFTIVGNQLRTNAVFNFEAQSSLSIRVRSTDSGGLFFEKVFTITVNNVNEAPTDIALDNASVNENEPVGTPVGNFSTVDPDAGDTFTYTLVAGTGSADNGSFAIVGNQLRTAAMFNFEVKNSYSIRVRSTDSGGLFVEEAFTITIINVPEAPIAGNDAFDTVGNTLLEVDGESTELTPKVYFNGNVLANDTDPDGPSLLTVSLVSFTPGAVVTLNSDGTFTYVPPAGATGTDTFTYNVSDGILTSAVPGTVTITLKHRVWYVKNNQAAGGLGRSTDPFDTLGEAQTVSTANDTIYVFLGDGTVASQNAGIVLKNGQRLIGEGVALDVPVSVNSGPNPTVLRAAGTYAKIHNNTDDGGEDAGISIPATAASLTGIEIRGLDIAGIDNAIDLTATGANNAGVTIANNLISGATLEGIDVNAGSSGTVTVSISNNAVLAGGTAIDLTRTLGTLYISGFANNAVSGNSTSSGIQVIGPAIFDANPSTGALDVVSGGLTMIGQSGNPVGSGITHAGMHFFQVTGSLSFTDLDIFSAGYALFVQGTGAFTGVAGTSFQVGANVSTIIGTNGGAVDVRSATIDLQLAQLTSTTSTFSTAGVNLDTVVGQFHVPAGSSSSITKAAGIGSAFGVLNSSATVDYGGSLNVTTGAGVALSGNTGTTTFRGGMTLSTGSDVGFSATGGGTVNVIDPVGLANNTVATTTATAVNISGTTIGANGVTFESINSTTAGSNVAIVLANTGSGQFSVTGAAGAGTGGTISNKSVDAMTMNNTDGLVSLKNMIIQDIGDLGGGFDTTSNDDAIHGQQVDGGLTLDSVTIRRISDQAVNGATLAGNAATVWNGLTITNSTIENTNRFHVANTADDTNEGMVRILGIRGTVSITNSTLQDGAEMVDFFVTGGTLNMTVTNTSFARAYKEFTSGALASQGGHCIDVTVQGASNANVTIGDRNDDALDNSFLNCRLASVRVAADSTATGNIDVIIGRNDFTVNDHSSGFGGDFDFPQGGVAITSQPTTPDSVTFDVVVDGNYFDEIANASGGVGQLTLAMANGTWQVLVEDNTFDTPGNAPWFLRADSTTSAKVLFQNNLGIKGFFNCPDASCAGGYNGPGLRSLADLQNGAVLDMTIINDTFAEHDAGFDPGQTFEARTLNTGGGGTLCLDLQNNRAPDGYSLEEFGGDFNLVGSGTCPVGSPSANCQTLLGNRGNRGGSNVATTNPPFVNVEVGATIDVVPGACQQPSGGIF